MGFLVEHVDKPFTYDLAFLFRLGNSGKLREELLGSVNTYHIQSETFIVAQHVGKLILAQHAVVNEYTCQILAYCLVQ